MKIALLYFYELMIGIIVMSPVFSNKTALASDQSFIAVSFATFDIIQQQKLSAEGRLEYRLNKGNWQFDPFAGLMANLDAARYVYAGFLYEFLLFRNFHLIPSFAPGFYYGGKSRNLHFGLEFRSQIEIAHYFKNDMKIGMSFSHISNASLGKPNPGVESFAITIVVPVN